MPSFSIIIIGAGIVGLASAIRLTQTGHKVLVLERKANFSGSGGGIIIAPNALTIFKSWGGHLITELEKIADTTGKTNLRRFDTGQILHENRQPPKGFR